MKHRSPVRSRIPAVRGGEGSRRSPHGRVRRGRRGAGRRRPRRRSVGRGPSARRRAGAEAGEVAGACGAVRGSRCGRPEPECRVAWLERLAGDAEHLVLQRAEVDVLAEPSGEGVESALGVVGLAVEASVDGMLDVVAQWLEGRSHGECGERYGERAGLPCDVAQRPADQGDAAQVDERQCADQSRVDECLSDAALQSDPLGRRPSAPASRMHSRGRGCALTAT